MALDTSERDRLEAQIDAHRLECRRLEESLAQANLSVQILRAELETNKTELSRLKKRKFPSSADQFEDSRRGPMKFLRRAILGHGTNFQCRTVAFDQHYGIFLVSRSEGESSGGIVKVSLWDASGSEFVALHDGPVRAIASSPHGDGLFLTCAADDRLKLSTMSSNSVLQTWKLPSSPWSCAFHPGSINHVAVGLASGQVALYDIRCPATLPQKMFKLPESNYPVHSVFILKHEGSDDKYILVGATLEGAFAFNLNPSDSDSDSDCLNKPFWTSNFGYKNFVCCSLSLDKKAFLASFRSVPPRDPSRHVLFEFSDDCSNELELKLPFHEFKSETLQANKIPFRSTIHNSECFIPDETNFTAQCYILSDSTPQEILSTNAGIPLIETCAGVVKRAKRDPQDDDCESSGTLVVGLLTTKNLYIYTT